MKKNTRGLFQDFLIILISIGVAVVLMKTQVLVDLLTSTREIEFIGSFIAGIFFTSIFTTAPAIVALGEIAQADSLLLTALFGAAGALLGDLLIFRFMRDRFAEHVMRLLGHQGSWKRFRALLHLKTFRWLTLLAGGFIIASPLPDELGITLLGFSKIRPSWFVVLSFGFNFLGIILIGLIARAL